MVATGLIGVPLNPPKDREPEKWSLPIVKVLTEVHILENVAAQVTIKQTFCHKFVDAYLCGLPLCVSYLFPLDSSSAVCDFYAILESGVKIQGIVKEKQEAKQEFVQAVQQGKKAFLMSSEESDIFRCDVGNMNPGETCEIVLSYVTNLQYDGPNIRFRLPQSITPRYGSSDVSAMGTFVNYPIEIKGELFTSSPITNIQTITFTQTLQVKRNPDNPKHAIFRMKQDLNSEGLGDDIICLIGQEKPYETSCMVEQSKQFGTQVIRLSFYRSNKMKNLNQDPAMNVSVQNKNFAGVFIPAPEGNQQKKFGLDSFDDMEDDLDLDLDNKKVELIFLIDRSGSMSGAPMKAVKQCLSVFIRSLPALALFNLYFFNNTYTKLFPSSRAYSQKTMMKAQREIDQIEARGGTKLMEALREIYGTSIQPGYSRQILLLTDGAVSNVQQHIDLVKMNPTARVFTFGMGGSYSEALVKGLAKAGKGTFEGISNNKDVGSKVMRTLNRCMHPSMNSIQVRLFERGQIAQQNIKNEQSMILWPNKLPPIYPGDRTVVHCITELQESDSLNTKKYEIEIRCEQSDDNIITFRVPLSVNPFQLNYSEQSESTKQGEQFIQNPNELNIQQSGSFLVHRLAARARIAELEESSLISEETRRNEVLALALQCNLVSKYTSFIAVEKQYSGEIIRNRGMNDLIEITRPQPQVQYEQQSQRIGMARTSLLSGMNHSSKQKKSKKKKRKKSCQRRSTQQSDLLSVCADTSAFSSLQFEVEEAFAAPPSALKSISMHAPTFGIDQSFSFHRNSNGMARKSSVSLDSNEDNEESEDMSQMTQTKIEFGELIRMQNFDGSFNGQLYQQHSSQKDLGLNTLIHALSGHNKKIRDEILSTLIAMKIMTEQFAERKDEWKMIYRKAQKYVTIQLLNVSGGNLNINQILQNIQL